MSDEDNYPYRWSIERGAWLDKRDTAAFPPTSTGPIVLGKDPVGPPPMLTTKYMALPTLTEFLVQRGFQNTGVPCPDTGEELQLLDNLGTIVFSGKTVNRRTIKSISLNDGVIDGSKPITMGEESLRITINMIANSDGLTLCEEDWSVDRCEPVTNGVQSIWCPEVSRECTTVAAPGDDRGVRNFIQLHLVPSMDHYRRLPTGTPVVITRSGFMDDNFLGVVDHGGDKMTDDLTNFAVRAANNQDNESLCCDCCVWHMYAQTLPSVEE